MDAGRRASRKWRASGRSCSLLSGGCRKRTPRSMGHRSLYECHFQLVAVVMLLRRCAAASSSCSDDGCCCCCSSFCSSCALSGASPCIPVAISTRSELPRSAHQQSGGASGCCCRRRPSETLCGARGVAYSQAAGVTRAVGSHLSSRSHGCRAALTFNDPPIAIKFAAASPWAKELNPGGAWLRFFPLS